MSRRRIWHIGGGGTLKGSVTIHGNKNAALPCLAASLLLSRIGEELILDHVPRISDVETMSAILSTLGIDTSWTGSEKLTLKRARKMPVRPKILPDLARRIRASIVLLGPLAGLYRTCEIPKPGGDKIGGRPIGAHIDALTDLGVSITETATTLRLKRGPAKHNTVWLTEQSVTATLTTLLYSPFVSGTLTIQDAACEPHIQTLCRLLCAMGADIQGIGSSLLSVRWPHAPKAPRTPIALDDDYMEAATYAVAAAVTKSNLTLHLRSTNDFGLINRYFGWFGITTRLDEHAWHIRGASSTREINPRLSVIKAEPWPRLPTDIMSVLVVLATQCHGTLKCIEYMYDDRFGFVQALRDIGARIELMPPHAIRITGPTPLGGNELFLRPDIRSGAAMLVAALAAEGTTILHDRGGVIERGYQDLPQTLATLGAPIAELPTPF